MYQVRRCPVVLVAGVLQGPGTKKPWFHREVECAHIPNHNLAYQFKTDKAFAEHLLNLAGDVDS